MRHASSLPPLLILAAASTSTFAQSSAPSATTNAPAPTQPADSTPAKSDDFKLAEPTPISTNAEPIAEKESPIKVSLNAGGSFTFSSNLNSTPGSVSISRASGGVDVIADLSSHWTLVVNSSVEGSWYDFSGVVAPFSNGTFEGYNALIFSTLRYDFNDTWACFFGGAVEFTGETNADAGKSFTGGGFMGVRYAFNKDLAVKGGLIIASRLEKATLYEPIIGIEWQITPKVRFETTRLGGRLTATLSPVWSVFIDGEYETRDFRLENSGPNPEGIMRDRRAPVGLGVEFKPTPHFIITFMGGAIVYQEYKIDNSNGVELTHLNTQPTGFISLTGTIKF